MSFSLVAGAFIVIYITNKFTDASVPTMNINSTGAKKFYPAGRHTTTWNSDTYYSTNDTKYYFTVYNGSDYYAIDRYQYRYYSDSSD